MTSKKDKNAKNFEKIVNKKIKHLKRHFNFCDEELVQIKKMYAGQAYDELDKGVQKLLAISKDLCKKYNQIVCSHKSGLLELAKNTFKKAHILRLLFPIHGMFGGTRQIEAVVGMVDLGRFVFFNKDVKFCANTLVTIGKRTLFGVNICVGDDNLGVTEVAVSSAKQANTALNACDTRILQSNDQRIILPKKVFIGDDCWIGAGAKICGGTKLGSRVVVAGGAVVGGDNAFQTTFLDDTLILGRPGIAYANLTQRQSKPKGNVERTTEQLQNAHNALKLVKKQRLTKKFDDILLGKKFNTANLPVGNLFLLTHRLCAKYNDPCTTQSQKQQILDIIFAGHGKNFKVGTNLCVDLLGTIQIGDNVCIGSGVYLAGNIFIQSNVSVGDGCTIFGSEHDLDGKKRKHALKRYTWLDKIEILDGVSIGANCVIAPNSVVGADVPANALYTNKKIYN